MSAPDVLERRIEQLERSADDHHARLGAHDNILDEIQKLFEEVVKRQEAAKQREPNKNVVVLVTARLDCIIDRVEAARVRVNARARERYDAASVADIDELLREAIGAAVKAKQEIEGL